jgi:adenylate cyclase
VNGAGAGGPGDRSGDLPVTPRLRSTLHDLGTSDDEIDRAVTDGTLALLVVERLVMPEPACHDIEAVAARSGMPQDRIAQIWRSLGFAQPRPGELVFTDDDLETLAQVEALMAADLTTPELVLHMSRVIGSSAARVASAHADVIGTRVSPQEPSDAMSDERVIAGASVVLPLVPKVLEATWRRHLHAAACRRMARALAGEEHAGVVGFADLVGFTALSQQVTDHELAVIVEQFEDLAFEVVTAGGGRVVKMIGDEVMFTVPGPPAAAEIALALAEGTRDADELSDVRVGMAQGPLLEREGDLYGPVVNLANRVTRIAFPGSILVSEPMRDQLVDTPGYVLRPMRGRYLKDIGRVPLWVLRRGQGAQSRFAQRRRALREATRARVDADG